jgi:hypothetical protein
MNRFCIVGFCIMTLTGGMVAAQESWQTYRNERFGYEISYPSDFEYKTYIDGSSGELRDAATGQRLVDFEVWPPGECPRQPAGTSAGEVGIARAKTVTQADGPMESSYCGDPLTIREYSTPNGTKIYELELTCVRETFPESYDDTVAVQADAAPSDMQSIIIAMGKKGPTYFVDISQPWRKRILMADPVGVDPRMQKTKAGIDRAVLRQILKTLQTFPIRKPPGICIEDLRSGEAPAGMIPR